jgi:hypothetical protein
MAQVTAQPSRVNPDRIAMDRVTSHASSDVRSLVVLFLVAVLGGVFLNLLGGPFASPTANLIYAALATVVSVFCVVRAVQIVRSNP